MSCSTFLLALQMNFRIFFWHIIILIYYENLPANKMLTVYPIKLKILIDYTEGNKLISIGQTNLIRIKKQIFPLKI